MDTITSTLNTVKGYKVVDCKTGYTVKEYRNEAHKFPFRTATRRADKLDLAYGAVRYSVERIY